MSIGYDREISGGNDPTKTTGSHGPSKWSLGKPVRLSERQVLPSGTSIISFADDTLVVCAADNVRILELERWLDSRGLKMAPEKTEALLVTDRRSFQYPRIVLGEHEIE